MPGRDSRKRRRCHRWFQPMHPSRIFGEQDRTLLAVECKSRQRLSDVGALPMASGVNERSVCGGRRRDRRGQSQEGRERLGNELGRRSNELTALPERGDAGEDIAKKRHRARRVGPVRGAERLLQGPAALDHFGRPGANELLEPADGVLHHRRVAALGGQPGTIDEHRGVLGSKREQLLEQALRLGVGISAGGVLHLLNERRASVKTSRVELDSAAELGDRLVPPSEGVSSRPIRNLTSLDEGARAARVRTPELRR